MGNRWMDILTFKHLQLEVISSKPRSFKKNDDVTRVALVNFQVFLLFELPLSFPYNYRVID